MSTADLRQRTPNVARLLTQSATRWPERPALTCGDQICTWGELDRRVDALAAALSARGVSQGDAVLIVSPNRVQMVVTMFAVLRLGAVMVPANFRLTASDLRVMIETAKPVAVVLAETAREHGPVLAPLLGGPQLVISMDGDGPLSVDALVESHRDERPPVVDIRRGDAAWYFFTSGSSGRPKAAVLTHDQLAFVAVGYLRDLIPDSCEQDASLVVAPLSHGAGTHLITQVAAGAHSVLLSSDSLDPSEAWELVERHRITNLWAVPTIVKMLVEHPSVDGFDRSSLRQVVYAGAPMYRHDQELAREKLGEVLVQFYGMAEVTSCITMLSPADHGLPAPDGVPFTTCGVARTGMQISIQDEQGAELPAGEAGEVCVAGPGVFPGYLDNPVANAVAFRDGWFRTGDVGFLASDGHLYLTGRASDMYISGGSNVDPRELEEKILEHPALAEVSVVGIPDPVWGEVGVAVCVARTGTDIEGAELLAWMRENIARYKVPKQVLIWDSLPRSSYGKITKKLVREAMHARGEL